jgi:putative SOS response-associated peptidase YedK
MCGRYTIAAEPELLEERFGATFAEPTERRYNAAPSQGLPVILNQEPEHIRLVSWGINPWWLKRSRGDGLINVRVETLRTRLRDDLAERRCLVLADGFYEWAKTPQGKVPYRFVLSDRAPFAFAGTWEDREDALGRLPSFAILTTAADAVVSPIHNRMPVILSPEVEREWISASGSPDEVLSMVKGERGVALEAYPVSPFVNRASVDTPELIDAKVADIHRSCARNELDTQPILLYFPNDLV